MNRKINQTCQKINYNDILNRKHYSVWFFTNERINSFLSEIEDNQKIKKVFSVGGGGDFVFSFLSIPSLSIDEVNLCDIRQMANLSIDFKIALFKKLEYEEILNLFLEKKKYNKEEIYRRVKKTISPASRRAFDLIIEDSKEDDFLKCLKTSGLWYKNSFWQIKDRKEYLPYLTSKQRFHFLQNNLKSIKIHIGSLKDNLKLFKDNYYDLIYTSNIFDSKNYCSHPDLCLKIIRKKINKNGLLFVITQKNANKIINLLKKEGFSLYKKKTNRFSLISSFLGHYSYSFLLFKKNNF